MAQGIQVPVSLYVENLQKVVSDLRSQLGNLKVGSSDFKQLEGIIKRIENEMDKLQARASKPFVTESQFSAANKSVDKIEEELGRIQSAASRIKFSSLNLDASQKGQLKAVEDQITNIQNRIKGLKEETKQSFLGSSAGKDWLNLHPEDASKTFEQITNRIANAVQRQNAIVEEAKQKLEEYNRVIAAGQTAEKVAATKGTNKDPVALKTLLGGDFNTFFNQNAKGAISFKPGENTRGLFEQWLVSNFNIDPSVVSNLVKQSAPAIAAALNDAQSAIRQELEKSIAAGQNATSLKISAGIDVGKEGAQLQALTTIFDAATTAGKNFTSANTELQNSVRAAGNQLTNLQNTMAQNAQTAPAWSAAIQEGKKNLNELQNTLAKTNSSFLQQQRTLNNFNAIKMAIVNFMGFRQTINLVSRGVREALNHIQELDSVMNKISIVTDMSTGDLWNQVGAYSDLAQKYGTSIKGAYEVSQIYYQQGLDTADVMTLTNETLKLAKVSGLDYAQTTDYMTTAIRGFKMEMSDAGTVVDVYSNLAAHTAVTQEELAVAMSKTASSMEGVGATFKESSAMISTMVAVTRESATNIGTALKSIASRYGEMKSDPLKMVDAEGDALSYNKVDTALQSVGITLKTTDGQFRNFTDVIVELSEKWDQLESTQQRYIATQFAGNRQQSRFLALVSNKDLLKQNLQYAEESEDVGTLQALKTLDSIKSKTEQVKVAYQQMYTSVGLEDMWKGALDGTKNFINTLNSLPKLFGKIPIGAIAMVADIIKVIKDLGLKALGGLSGIWEKIFPTDIAEQKGAEVGDGFARGLQRSMDKIPTEKLLQDTGAKVNQQMVTGSIKDENDATHESVKNQDTVEKIAASAAEASGQKIAFDTQVQIDNTQIAEAAAQLTATFQNLNLSDVLKEEINKIDFASEDKSDQINAFCQNIINAASDNKQALYDKFVELGLIGVGQATTEGIESGQAGSVGAATKLGEAVLQALHESINANSPSPTIIALFRNGVGDAIEIGLESSVDSVTAAATKLGIQVPKALQEALEKGEKIKLGDYLSLEDSQNLISAAATQESLLYQSKISQTRKEMRTPGSDTGGLQSKLDDLQRRKARIDNINPRINNLQYEGIPTNYLVAAHNFDPKYLQQMAENWQGNLVGSSVAMKSKDDKPWTDFADSTAFINGYYMNPANGYVRIHGGDGFTPVFRLGDDVSTVEKAIASLASQPETTLSPGGDMSEFIRDSRRISSLQEVSRHLGIATALPFGKFHGSDHRDSHAQYADRVQLEEDVMKYALRSYLRQHPESGISNQTMPLNGAELSANGAMSVALRSTFEQMGRLEDQKAPVGHDDLISVLRTNLQESFTSKAGVNISDLFTGEDSLPLLEQGLKYINFLKQNPKYDWAEGKVIDKLPFESIAGYLSRGGDLNNKDFESAFEYGLDPRRTFLYDGDTPNSPINRDAVAKYMINNVPDIAFDENGPLITGTPGVNIDFSLLKEQLNQAVQEGMDLPPMEIDAIMHLMEDTANSDLGQVLTNTLQAGLSNINFSDVNADQQLEGLFSFITDNALDDIPALSAAGEDTARFIITGLAQGIMNNIEAVQAASESAGKAAIEGINTGAGVSSPSVYAIACGRFIMLGLKEGIDDATAEAIAAAEKAGTVLITTIEEGVYKLDADKLAKERLKEMYDNLTPEKQAELLAGRTFSEVTDYGPAKELNAEDFRQAIGTDFDEVLKIQGYSQGLQEAAAEKVSQINAERKQLSALQDIDIQAVQSDYNGPLGILRRMLHPGEMGRRMEEVRASYDPRRQALNQAYTDAVNERINMQNIMGRTASEAEKKVPDVLGKTDYKSERVIAEYREQARRSGASISAEDMRDPKRIISSVEDKLAETPQQAKIDISATPNIPSAEESAEKITDTVQTTVNEKPAEIKTEVSDNKSGQVTQPDLLDIIRSTPTVEPRDRDAFVGEVATGAPSKATRLATWDELKAPFQQTSTETSNSAQAVESETNAYTEQIGVIRELIKAREELKQAQASGNEESIKAAQAAKTQAEENFKNLGFSSIAFNNKQLNNLATGLETGDTSAIQTMKEAASAKNREQYAEELGVIRNLITTRNNYKAAQKNGDAKAIAAAQQAKDEATTKYQALGLSTLKNNAQLEKLASGLESGDAAAIDEVTAALERQKQAQEAVNAEKEVSANVQPKSESEIIEGNIAELEKLAQGYQQLEAAKNRSFTTNQAREDENNYINNKIDSSTQALSVNGITDVGSIEKVTAALEEQRQKLQQLREEQQSSGGGTGAGGSTLAQDQHTVLENKVQDTVDKLVEVKAMSEEAGNAIKDGLSGASTQELQDQLAELQAKLKDAGAEAQTTGSKLKNAFTKNVGSIGAAMSMLSGLFDKTTLGGQQAAGAIAGIGGAIRIVDALSKAAAGSNPWMGLAMGIMGLVNGISMFVEDDAEKLERLSKAAEEAQNKAKQAKSEYNNLNTNLNKYDELAEKRYESEEAAEAYQEQVNKLAESFPALVSGFDDAGNAIIDVSSREEVLADARKATAQATLEAARAEKEHLEEQIRQKANNVDNNINTFGNEKYIQAKKGTNTKLSGSFSSSLTSLGIFGIDQSTLADSKEFGTAGVNQLFSNIQRQIDAGGLAPGTTAEEQAWYNFLTTQFQSGLIGEPNEDGYYEYDVTELYKVLKGRQGERNTLPEGERISAEEDLMYEYLTSLMSQSNDFMSTIHSGKNLEELNIDDGLKDILNSEEAKDKNDLEIANMLIEKINLAAKNQKVDDANKYYSYLMDFINILPDDNFFKNAYGEDITELKKNSTNLQEWIQLVRQSSGIDRQLISGVINNKGLYSDEVSKKGDIQNIAIKAIEARYNGLKEEDQKGIETWVDTSSDATAIVQNINTWWASLASKYNKTGENLQDKFLSMIGDLDHYSVSDIINELQLDETNDFDKQIIDYIRTTYGNISDSIEKGIISNLESKLGDSKSNNIQAIIDSANEQASKKDLTQVDATFYNNLADQVKLLENTGHGAQAENLVEYGTEFKDNLEGLDEAQRNAILDTINKYGFTKEGLDQVRKTAQLQKVASDDPIYTALDHLETTVIPNIQLSISTMISDLVDNWSDTSKGMKKLTSGIDFTEMQGLLDQAESFGDIKLANGEKFTLDRTDFRESGDKLVLTAQKAQEYWEAYSQYNKTTAEKFTTDLDTAWENLEQGELIDNDHIDDLTTIMGSELDNYLVDGKLTTEAKQIEKLRERLAEKYQDETDDIAKYLQYLDNAGAQIVKSIQWSEGDYSSLKSIVGENTKITDLMKMSDKQITEQWKDQPDVQNAIDKARTSLNSLLTDVVTKYDIKSIEDINLDSYKGLPQEIVAEIKGMMATGNESLSHLVQTYIKEAKLSIGDANDLILKAYEKDNHIVADEVKAVKNLQFIDKDHFTATSAELKDLADALEIDIGTLLSSEITHWDETLQEYIVDATKIEGLQGVANISETVRDSVNTFINQLTTLIKNGLSGSLTNVDAKSLQNWAGQNGIGQLNFKETASGLKLSTDSAIQLYQALKKVDAVRADLTFDELSKDLQENNENYQSVSSILNRINELESMPSSARSEEYARELELAKEILSVRSTSEDSGYKFMSNKIPAAQNNPLNYYNDWASAIQKLDTAMGTSVKDSKGTVHKNLIDYQDWYNIVTELNNLAGQMGTALKIGTDIHGDAIELNGDLESAAELIEKGAQALTADSSGNIKVSLGDIGIDFEAGAGDFSSSITSGIQTMAKSQVDMLDSLIALLETVVAMEGLSDVAGADMNLDLGDIFTFEYDDDNNNIVFTGFTEDFKKYQKTIETMPDELQQQLDQTKVKFRDSLVSIKDLLLENFNNEFESLSMEDATKYQKILNGFLQAALSGDYDLDNVFDSVKKELAKQGLDLQDFVFEITDSEGKVNRLIAVTEHDEISINIDDDDIRAQVDAAYKDTNYKKDKEQYREDVQKAFEEYVAGKHISDEKGKDGEIVYGEDLDWDAKVERRILLTLAEGEVTFTKTKAYGKTKWEATYKGQKFVADNQEQLRDLVGAAAVHEDEGLNFKTKISDTGDFSIEYKKTIEGIEVTVEIDDATNEITGYTYKGQHYDTEDKLMVALAKMGELKTPGVYKDEDTGETAEVHVSKDGSLIYTYYLDGEERRYVYQGHEFNSYGAMVDYARMAAKYALGDKNKFEGDDLSDKQKKDNVSWYETIDLYGKAKVTITAYTDGTIEKVYEIDGQIIDSQQAFDAYVAAAEKENSDIKPIEGGWVISYVQDDVTVKVKITPSGAEYTADLPDDGGTITAASERELNAALAAFYKPQDTTSTSDDVVKFTIAGITYRIQYKDGKIIYLNDKNEPITPEKPLSKEQEERLGEYLEDNQQTLENPVEVEASKVTITVGEASDISLDDTIKELELTSPTDVKGTVNHLTLVAKETSAEGEVEDLPADIKAGLVMTDEDKAAFMEQVAKLGATTNVTLNPIADAIDTLMAAGFKSTVTLTPKMSGSWWSLFFGGGSAAGTIGNAMAQGTLMGELGPELVVSDGKYFVAGQNGPEMVNLSDDAIVFNHLQTEQLLTKGTSSQRGKAITNERKAVSYAKGNINGGPAKASASAALATLKQLRSQWASLAGLSAQDLAGTGGGGGGGGNKNYLKDLEQWYNWLQKIAALEKDINYYEAERNRISSEYAPSGTEYFNSQKKSLESLQEQLETQAALNQSQEQYFNSRRKYLNSNNNPFSALYEFDETGQLKYKDGMYEKLAYMSGTDEYGNANMTAQEQYDYIVNTLGISADYMKYNSSGEEIDSTDYASMVQAFWDKIDADKSEMQSLYDNIKDGQEQLESLQQQQNEILKDMRDNQMAVETKVYNAIVEIRQRVIDELTDTKEAIQDSNDKFIQGLNDALSKEQTMYNNNESRKELDRLRRQRDVLMRSGGSAAEISSLNDQISDQEQSVYFEKWQEEIDAIQAASDKQIEKLEAQIQLETEILDYQKKHGLLWGQVTDIMNQSPEKIANFIAQNTEEYWNKSPVASADAMNQLTFSIEKWTGYRDSGATLQADIEAIKAALGSADEDDDSGDHSGGEWKQGADGRYWYKHKDNTYTKNDWEKINGKWYHFDAEGWMESNRWVQGQDGKWYYLGSDGAMVTGKQTIDGKEYEFGEDGALIKSYATGGLADFTGIAKLDGTKSKPEAVLNASQTKVLRDNILSNKPNSLVSLLKSYNNAYKGLSSNTYDSINTNNSNSTQIGKAEVNLNIDKLANDYDAKRAANTVMDEMLRIASKTGATNGVRR